MLNKRLRNKRGQALVEFSLSSILYFILMFLACDAALMTYQWAVVQYSVNQGARVGSIGYNPGDEITSSGMSKINAKIKISGADSRVAIIKKIVHYTAESLHVSIPESDIEILDENRVPISNSVDTTPEALMFIRAVKEAELPISQMVFKKLFNALGVSSNAGDIKFELSAEVLTKNEPFITF